MILRHIKHRIKLKHIVIAILVLITLKIGGIFIWLFEKDFNTEFNYPYEVDDLEGLVYQLRNGEEPKTHPLNQYNYKYTYNISDKCKTEEQLRLVYLVKSDPRHFSQRVAIRNAWGFEKRFSDVEIRTVFLLGQRDDKKMQKIIDDEAAKYRDIIQSNFVDNYFNNTIKTMMGMKWAVSYCAKARFYMFVDDDYYVSTKNVLRYLRHPTNYPNYLEATTPKKGARKLNQAIDLELPHDVKLYTGFVFRSKPLRFWFSKWYVSLDEYEYDYWPPYVTAGAYILSRSALLDVYYASLYTKHFRFDDIYVGILAHRLKIAPFHSEDFNFYKKPYDQLSYRYTIASHGYDDAVELLSAWNEQKSLGNA